MPACLFRILMPVVSSWISLFSKQSLGDLARFSFAGKYAKGLFPIRCVCLELLFRLWVVYYTIGLTVERVLGALCTFGMLESINRYHGNMVDSHRAENRKGEAGSPVSMSRKGYVGTSSGWLDFLGVVTSYVPFWASGVHTVQFHLTSPATFYEYHFMADLHIPNLHPFILGAWASWGAGFSVSVAQSRHLLLLALWSRRSCLAHGYYSVSRGCGVLSASEICLAFFPPPTPP